MIIIFTLRTLHRSRLAMPSVVAVSSAISSSSQRRPRAIDATRWHDFPNVAAERVAATFRHKTHGAPSDARVAREGRREAFTGEGAGEVLSGVRQVCGC